MRDGDALTVTVADPALAEEIWHQPEARQYLVSRDGPLAFYVLSTHRGWLKQAMVKIGWPIEYRRLR